VVNTATRQVIQSTFNAKNYDGTDKYYEERKAATTHGYTNQAAPIVTDNDIIAVYYFDDYDFDYNGTRDAGTTYVAHGLYPDPVAFDRIRGASKG